MTRTRIALLVSTILAATTMTGCQSLSQPQTFDRDAAFLSRHAETIVLRSEDGMSRIAVVPQYQGRVMTSTAGGEMGDSYGYLNYDLIRSGKPVPKISVWGGEDRFWMGPEGGQFAIFFKKGDEFTLEDWQTPAPIDSAAYEVVSKTDQSVTLTHTCALTNYSGTQLDVKVDRIVRLVDRAAVARDLGVDVGSSAMVAFESDNTITNVGSAAWTRESGLLSIWILGMFRPSDDCTVVIPFKQGSEAALGPIVKDDYFGKVPEDRLEVSERAIFFKADSRMRTKIGVGPGRSLPVCGSWNPSGNVLTIVSYTLQPGTSLATPYINSMWEMQKDPYAGDVINSYNDAPGKHGPTFYELETSSPALALSPGQSASHLHRTIHLTGERVDLDRIAKHVLGVGLDEIEDAIR